MKRRTRVKSGILVALLFVMINLPVVHSSYLAWRIQHSGTDVSALVTQHRVLPPSDDPEYFLEFVLPPDLDPDQRKQFAEVDRETYERGLAEERLRVRVLADEPSAYAVDGQVTSRTLGIVITLLADLALLLMLLLLWRFGDRLRPQLRGVAVGDVERCPPGFALERIEGERYLVRGEVSVIEGDEMVLDLGGRSVRIDLDGHHNPVGHQQPAQVEVRLVG